MAREVRAAFGALHPHQVSAFTVQALTGKWKTNVSHATYYSRSLALRSFLRLLDATTGTKLADTVNYGKPPGPRKTIATPEESARLFAMAQPWLRVWLVLCTQLGLRNAEARRLRPENYNREKGLITFRKKGGEDHILPITPDIAALLDTAPQGPEDWTYVERWKGSALGKTDAVSTNVIYYHWNKLKRDAGVRRTLIPHDLRRTIAVNLYQLCHDLRAVQQFLGHKSLASTTAYLAPLTEDQIRQYHKLLNFHSQVKQ